jgi:hypothetical protein
VQIEGVVCRKAVQTCSAMSVLLLLLEAITVLLGLPSQEEDEQIA